jgi:hypothetical protein
MQGRLEYKSHMIQVICRIAAQVVRLSFVAAVPPRGVLLFFRGTRPAWAGGWLERLLSAARLVRRGESEVGLSGLGTSGRVLIARGGKPRAEFERGSFLEFRFQAIREAEDFAALLARVQGRIRTA